MLTSFFRLSVKYSSRPRESQSDRGKRGMINTVIVFNDGGQEIE